MVNDPTEPGRVHIWVSGRVQGVGFRAFVQYYGTSLKLGGWVRNVGYDQVETVAEGPRSDLERFIQLVKEGPTASHVETAEIDWETPTGAFFRFDVR